MLAFTLVLMAVVAVGGTLAYLAFTLPVAGLLDPPPRPSMVLLDSRGQPFAFRGVSRGEAVAVRELPQHLVQAVLAAEDRRFYQHGGIDFRAVARAALANLRAGEVTEGGSTITQQLAKVTFLSPERTLRRKLQETLIALWLENQLHKDEIFGRYLSTVYFGAGTYGIDAAARRYFAKPAREVTLSEAVVLAGLIRAPSELAPTANPEASRRRSEVVLNAMLEAGWLDPSQVAAARSHPAQLAVPPEAHPGWNYFADWVTQEVDRRLGGAYGDFSVQTTLNPQVQDLAESIVARWLDTEGIRRKFGQAAMVVMAPDGAVLAMVGGRDYRQSQFNRATQAQRQPGSLFKLFVYLAALQEGFGPQDTFLDRPVRIGNWEPRNFSDRYRGEVSLTEAFAQSINSVAVQLADRVGPEKVARVARALGIQSRLEPTPSLALGTYGVNLLEITAAYAAVASRAKRVEPHGVKRITSRSQDLYQQVSAGTYHGPGLAHGEQIVDLLRAAVSEGTGKAARVPGFVAGKTGTSQDYRDAWFVGFTSDLVVGVWVGNDDNAPTARVTGGDIPAKMWRDVVLAASPSLSRMATAGSEPVSPPPADVPLAPDTGLARESAAFASTPPVSRSLTGRALVLDTGTVRVAGRLVHLAGVSGFSGRFVAEMRNYVGDREVTCEPFEGNTYRCQVGGHDLSEVVLFNGAGKASADAPADLLTAQAAARAGGRGVWGRR